MNTRLDQLANDWANAEIAEPQPGDTIIIYEGGDEYTIMPNDHPFVTMPHNIRILERAPKPKPAWHDAVAVIAHTAGDKERRAMVKCGETRIGRGPMETSWDDSAYGAVLDADDLIDPVPLIEAKVTDEMRDRAWAKFVDLGWDGGIGREDTQPELDAILTAALGTDPA